MVSGDTRPQRRQFSWATPARTTHLRRSPAIKTPSRRIATAAAEAIAAEADSGEIRVIPVRILHGSSCVDEVDSGNTSKLRVPVNSHIYSLRGQGRSFFTSQDHISDMLKHQGGISVCYKKAVSKLPTSIDRYLDLGFERGYDLPRHSTCQFRAQT